MVRQNTYRFPFARYPAVRLALLFIGGILLSARLNIGLTAGLIVFGVCLLLFLLSEAAASRRVSFLIPKISTFLFVLIIFTAGSIRFQFASSQNLKPAELLLSASPWEEIVIGGRVADVTANSKGKIRLNMEVFFVEWSAGRHLDGRIKSRIIWDLAEAVQPGDSIKITATVIPIAEIRNPDSFDYKQFLAAQGIHSQFRADSLIERRPLQKMRSWFGIRNYTLGIIDKNFSPTTAPIAKALLLGYKNELEGETKAAFARSGLSHIMAVSGLHVGLVVAPFWLIIPLFWTRKHGPLIGLLILTGVLFFYAGITGFSASVLRASIMAIAFTYGKLFSKRGDSINITAAAALIILLINPRQLFEIGFQLSFAAVLIILLIMPVVQARLPYKIRTKWYGIPVMAMIISLVVQVGLYPLQVYYFKEVSVISPLANALFVPALSVIVPLAILGIFISMVWPVLGFVINYPALLFLEAMSAFVHHVAGYDWAWMKASPPSAAGFLFWLMLVFTFASWRRSTLRWKFLAAGLAGLVVLLINIMVAGNSTRTLELIVFDVGQGDANLIRTPSNKFVLIDTGIWNPNSNSGEQVLLPYFKARGISRLDAVILTHPHADHIGGIISLIEGIEIANIYNSGYEYDSDLYRTYLEKAAEKNIGVKSVQRGDSLNIDPAVLFLILGPDAAEHSNDPNQHSVIVGLVYGNTRFLFTGDAGLPQEQKLVSRFGDFLRSDFLKVGHHGSRTSSGSDFLNRVNPAIATVSLADKNKFKHPHPEAVTALYGTGAQLLFTAKDRGLVFESDGETVKQRRWY